MKNIPETGRVQQRRRSRPVCLIAAVPLEAGLILRRLTRKRPVALPGQRCVQGMIGDRQFVVAVSGIGKTNAAFTAAALIQAFDPESLISLGAAGAYPGAGLSLGDLVIVDREMYGDEGVLSAQGFSDMETLGFPLLTRAGKTWYNEIPLDRKLTSRIFRQAFEGLDFPVVIGGAVTVSTCSGTPARASFLSRRFNAVCENMEGAAVAHAARRSGIAAAEIRGISNMAGDRDKRRWDLALAAGNCQKAVLAYLQSG